MKTVALLTLFLGFAVSGAIAQEGESEQDRKHNKENLEKKSPEEKAKHHTDKMTEVLSLSKDQATEIKQINLEHFKEMEEIKKEMKALKKKAKEAHKKTKKEVEKVLTPDQITKMEEEHEKHKKKREERRREKCCQGQDKH